MKPHRVVITGMGLVTALGTSVEQTWKRLIAGESGIRPVQLFDVSSFRGKSAGEIGELPETVEWKGRQKSSYRDRSSRMLTIAVQEAFLQSGILRQKPAPLPMVLGTTGGGMRSGEIFHRQLVSGRSRTISTALLRNYVPQQQAIDVQNAFGFEGPILITANACATGANAVGYGFHLVRSGQSDVVLCAAYDALCELIFAGFDSLQAVTTELCRPFDKNRSGLVIGEGAGVLVLESAGHASRRGAVILAEVAGYGQSIDTHHLTQPQPEGDGAVAAMREAIQVAGLNPADIDHVNAHGTATPQNDAMESRAIHRCFGTRAKDLPVTSVKAALGHLLGGAGSVEAVISALTLQHQLIPPTLHYETVDPACDIPIVAKGARTHRMGSVLSNSFGFGGANAALVFCTVK